MKGIIAFCVTFLERKQYHVQDSKRSVIGDRLTKAFVLFIVKQED